MNPSEVSEILGRAPLFEALGDDELAAIACGASERRLEAGEWVFQQGDPSREMFIVAEGRLRAVLMGEDAGPDREVGELGPGDHFGEAALLDGGRRGASIQALTDTRVIGLQREHVIAAVRATPELGLDLCRGFVRLLQAGRSRFLSIPFVDVEDPSVLGESTRLLSPSISLACQAIVLARAGDRVTVGMVDPYDRLALGFIRDVLAAYRVDVAAIGRKAFTRATEAILRPALAAGGAESVAERLRYIDGQGVSMEFGDGEGAQVLREVFARAVAAGASDVHFEPTRGSNRVRLRLDGSMFTVREGIPDGLFRRLIARIKAMSDLDTTNTRLPEDGRFLLEAGGEQVEVRVATAPCLGGQKAALRLVDPRRRHRELGSLFVTREAEQLCRDILMNPSGLALVVGPTGCGKTTTLYAGLSALWDESRTINVVTIEDPVEYELPFASQMQVNPGVGLGFESLLRATLRQNPDVILIGEIRDAASASIATEAAGTGHLVLSSLHTDSTVDAVVRLRRLGVPPYLLAACLRGVIGQRLLPAVCPQCAVEVGPDDEPVRIARRIGLLPEDFDGRLRRGSGCAACRSTGEQGRTAVFEMLAVDDALRALIEDDEGASRLRSGLDGSRLLPLERYAGMLLERGLVSPERAISLFPKVRGRARG